MLFVGASTSRWLFSALGDFKRRKPKIAETRSGGVQTLNTCASRDSSMESKDYNV